MENFNNIVKWKSILPNNNNAEDDSVWGKNMYIYKLKSTNNDEFIWKIIL